MKLLWIIGFLFGYDKGFETLDLNDIEYGIDISRKTSKYEKEESVSNIEGEVEFGKGYESGTAPNHKTESLGSTGSHGFQYGSQFKSPIMDDFDQWNDWGIIQAQQNDNVESHNIVKSITEQLKYFQFIIKYNMI